VLLHVIIPVYNERATLENLVARLDATPPPRTAGAEPVTRRIVLIDDGSRDGTTEIVRRLGERADVLAVLHKQNMGKGAAVRSGLTAALQDKTDLVIIQDGDLEYDPADHEPVLRPILDGRADAVIGSRFLGHSHRVLYYWHWVANQVISQFCNMLTNLNLSDIECCFKAMSRPVAERIRIEENRFGLEPELVARLARMRLEVAANPGGPIEQKKLRIYEVPVSYAGRTYAEGKKIGWKDGVRALWCILKYNLLT
jgi:glycosyltransferase involved in cell wall biosynthesis